jgi:hypothetical protein
MGRCRYHHFWALHKIGRVALSAVLLAVFVGDARGQSGPPLPRNPSWAPGNITFQQQANNVTGLPDQGAIQESQRRYAGAKMAEKYAEDRAKMWTALLVYLPKTLLGIGALVLLAVLGRLYLRFGATTDPERLAQSDPWLRARLAQANVGDSGRQANAGLPQNVAAVPPPREGAPGGH